MDDRVLGGVILVGSLLCVACYFWLAFLSPWAMLVIQVSVFAAVAVVLWIVAWIGYTLATTPPPAPLEDFSESLDEESSRTEISGENVEETKK